MNQSNEHLDRFAKAVSLVFHPFVVVIPTIVIAMLTQGNTFWHFILWTLLAIGVVILPACVLIFWGVRSGRYSDSSVSIREQHSSIYALGGTLLVLLLVIIVSGKAPLILIACIVSAVLATLIGSLINQRFTKLSLHSAGMAGCATVLLLTASALGVLTVVFAPLVGWARIRLKHHTPVQILLGWVISSICVLVVFYYFHLIP